MNIRHRVVIIGGGFGGLAAAKALRRSPVDITLIDRRNYHLFQPLLYQVATGELSPANIASPLRGILRHQRNCRVLMGEVTGIDAEKKLVNLGDETIAYDSLIVAAGVRHSYFGRDDWERVAPGLKTIEDATEIRKRLLYAFEAAERETDPALVHMWLTFVIVGAGPTGVELAGALSEIAQHTLKHDFRSINPADARVLLVEAAPRCLSMYPESLAARARAMLERLNVSIRTDTKVIDIRPEEVVVQRADQQETIRTRTVIWAAGVSASPLGKTLSDATGASLDRAGRVIVQTDLSLAGYPNVFVIGDLAHFRTPSGQPLPGVAQVALQQGRYVSRRIRDRLAGRSTPPFKYRDLGNMAVIGRWSAIADIGGRRLSGVVAWFLWLFVHLMAITQFRNRLLVLVQWGWTFFTRDRAARLITNVDNVDVDNSERSSIATPGST